MMWWKSFYLLILDQVEKRTTRNFMADEIILLYNVNALVYGCAVCVRLHSYLHTLEHVKLWFMQNTLHSTMWPKSILYFIFLLLLLLQPLYFFPDYLLFLLLRLILLSLLRSLEVPIQVVYI